MADTLALWDSAGDPLNVQGAIADALAWLDDLRRMPAIRRDIDATAALQRAMAHLAAYGDADARAQYKEPTDDD